VIHAIDVNAPLYMNAGPGGWNDPDMLIGSSNKTAFHISPVQSRTMFSLWSVMAAPLLIGSNIIDLSDWDLETYSNVEIIGVDQDTLGKQGQRIVGGNLENNRNLKFAKIEDCNEGNTLQTWKLLSNGILYNEALNLCVMKDSQSTYLTYEKCSKDHQPSSNQNLFYLNENRMINDKEECITLLPDGQILALQHCNIQSNILTLSNKNENLFSLSYGDKCLTATHEVTAPSLSNIWAKQLNKGYAVHFLNNDGVQSSVTCDVNCFSKMGFPKTGTATIKNLWTKKTVTFNLGNPFTAGKLEALGGSATYTFVLN